MSARFRSTLYTLVFCGVVLILAWRGTLDYLGLTVIAVAMGLAPALVKLATLYLKAKADDCDDRPDK